MKEVNRKTRGGIEDLRKKRNGLYFGDNYEMCYSFIVDLSRVSPVSPMYPWMVVDKANSMPLFRRFGSSVLSIFKQLIMCELGGGVAGFQIICVYMRILSFGCKSAWIILNVKVPFDRLVPLAKCLFRPSMGLVIFLRSRYQCLSPSSLLHRTYTDL